MAAITPILPPCMSDLLTAPVPYARAYVNTSTG
jgi:hypothetical protein